MRTTEKWERVLSLAPAFLNTQRSHRARVIGSDDVTMISRWRSCVNSRRDVESNYWETANYFPNYSIKFGDLNPTEQSDRWAPSRRSRIYQTTSSCGFSKTWTPSRSCPPRVCALPGAGCHVTLPCGPASTWRRFIILSMGPRFSVSSPASLRHWGDDCRWISASWHPTCFEFSWRAAPNCTRWASRPAISSTWAQRRGIWKTSTACECWTFAGPAVARQSYGISSSRRRGWSAWVSSTWWEWARERKLSLRARVYQFVRNVSVCVRACVCGGGGGGGIFVLCNFFFWLLFRCLGTVSLLWLPVSFVFFSALDSRVGPRLGFNVLYNKSKLRILECRSSDWINDATIETIAKNCPLVESLSVACCINVEGHSLQLLLMSCLNLTTLVLSCTSMRDRAALDTDWQLSVINELDVTGCHKLGAIGLSTMLVNLSHLRYLRCALTDDNLRSLQPRGEHKLELLQLHRQYPITLRYVSRWLSSCPQMKCLDVASIPLNSEHFELFLSSMPDLEIVNFAGYRALGLEDIIYSLAKHCTKLKAVSINFYHAANDNDVKQAFVVLIQRCRRLEKVAMCGLFVNSLVRDVIDLARYSCRRKDITIRENDNFVLPRPSLSIENMVKI